ncbi:MAG: AsmA family protein [bacterium]
MKKLGKILAGIVITLVALLLIVALTLPLTIGPVVKAAAKVGGPAALGVPVSVGDVKLRPLLGILTITQVKIGNPEGYSKNESFAVEKVEIRLKTVSLFSDTVVVKKVLIDAPAIGFESKDGKSNFDTMLANAKKNATEQNAKKTEEKRTSKKMVIEEFTLQGAKISYTSAVTFGTPLTLPLPSLTLRDIGKASGGATAADALTEIVNGIVGGLTKAVSDMGKAAGDVLKGSLKGAGDATQGAADAAKGASDAAKEAANKLKKLFK